MQEPSRFGGFGGKKCYGDMTQAKIKLKSSWAGASVLKVGSGPVCPAKAAETALESSSPGCEMMSLSLPTIDGEP